MKRIVLVRHATAVETGPEGSDFHRRLKKRGRREAAIMADRTAAIVGVPDVMVSSPADRAIETAWAFADRLSYPRARVGLREELYGGLLAEDFLRIVSEIDDVHSSVVFFGHDPSFSEFAALMVSDFADMIPRAGVVVIDVSANSWRRIQRGTGTLASFDRPPARADQKRIEEELADELARRVRDAVFAALKKVCIAENREVVKAVARAGVQVAAAVRPFVASSKVLRGGHKGGGRLSAKAKRRRAKTREKAGARRQRAARRSR